MRFVIVLALSIPMLFAEHSNMSGDMNNGRSWKAWTDSIKIGYLVGFADGAYGLAEAANSPAASSAVESFFAKGTIGDSKSELDRMYSDNANLNIPIRYMMHYCERVLKGEYTQVANEQMLIQLRKRANKLELK